MNKCCILILFYIVVIQFSELSIGLVLKNTASFNSYNLEVERPRIIYIKLKDNFSMKRDDYCTCMLLRANKYTYEIKREGRGMYDNALNLTSIMATKKLN